MLDNNSETRSAGVAWSQDLFRSGGIYYAVEQADASSKANLLAVDLEKASYLKQAYTLKAQAERDRLKLQQSELMLANRDIDPMITRAKYKVGSADISELNRVTIDRDSARGDVIVVRNSLHSEEFELKKDPGNTGHRHAASRIPARFPRHLSAKQPRIAAVHGAEPGGRGGLESDAFGLPADALGQCGVRL